MAAPSSITDAHALEVSGDDLTMDRTHDLGSASVEFQPPKRIGDLSSGPLRRRMGT
jgi:hypothetical protein